jgi:hypothetical protein
MSLTRNSDKIATIVNAVDCHPTWSDKRIAAETHTSRTVVWEIRRYILHEQHRRRGRERSPAETEAQIISLLRAKEKYKTIAATARCSITTIVKVARANGLSRRAKIDVRRGDRAI